MGTKYFGQVSANKLMSLIKAAIPKNLSQLTNDKGFITGADVPEGAAASTTPPKMDGVQTAGTEMAFARGDHVHPSDTSRLPFIVTVDNGTQKADKTYTQIKEAVDAGRAVLLCEETGSWKNFIPLTMLLPVTKHAKFCWYEGGSLTQKNVSDTGAVTGNVRQPVEIGDVNTAISSALTGVYTPKGTIAFSALPTAAADNRGWVYNISDAFTTTAAFAEGAGHSYPAGTNVVCIDAGSGSYQWDVMAGTYDMSEMTEAEVQAIWDSIA